MYDLPLLVGKTGMENRVGISLITRLVVGTNRVPIRVPKIEGNFAGILHFTGYLKAAWKNPLAHCLTQFVHQLGKPGSTIH